MEVVGLFFLLVPVVMAGALLVPAVVDLVTRSEHVTAWWAAPLVMLVPPTLLNLAVPTMMDPGMDRAIVPAFGWMLLHYAAAALLLGLAMGLAFSRGLRPGGETLRRRRTSLVALSILLASLLIPWLPGMLPLIWLVPAAWAGILWVIALNRRGPLRLERGKAVSASMLMASAVCFWLGTAHLLGFWAWTEPWDDALVGPLAWLGSLVVLAVLVGGLRFLAGPPDPGPMLAAAASGITLLGPFAWMQAFAPVPPSVQAPAWVDFVGREGPRLEPVHSLRCMGVVAADGSMEVVGDHCYVDVPDQAVVDARTPLDVVDSRIYDFLVDDGRYRITRYARWGDPVWILERDGKAVVWDPNRPDSELPVGMELGPAIRALTGDTRPLRIAASPRWTMQDFASMCASMGPRVDCAIEDKQ